MSTPQHMIPGGMNTPLADAEWRTFLARRRELIEDGMNILGMTSTLQQATGSDPTTAFGAVLQQYQQGALRQRPASAEDTDSNRLIGAARFYGISNPEQMSADQLKQTLEVRRAARRRDGTDPMTGLVGAFANNGLAAGGFGYAVREFAPSVVGGFLDSLREVPFIGDALSKIRAVQRAEQNVALLEEAALGEEVVGDSNFARGAARFTGQSFLYVAAGELVAASGFAAGVANPLVRGALQGGAAATLTETGGNDPIQDRLTRVAVVAGFGGVATWGVDKIIGKLGRSFPRPSQAAKPPNYATTDNLPSPYVRAVPEEDIPIAEWQFVDDNLPVVRRDPGPFQWNPSGAPPQPYGPARPIGGLLDESIPIQLGPGRPQNALVQYLDTYGTPPGAAPAGRESLLAVDTPTMWPVPEEAMRGGWGVPAVDVIEARLRAVPDDFGARAWYAWEIGNQLSMVRRLGTDGDQQVALAERVLDELIGGGEPVAPVADPWGTAKSEPLPLPNLVGLDPAQVSSAWQVVSARYPRLASRINVISALEPGYERLTGAAAAWEPNGLGMLRVSPSRELDPATLFHELVHVAQEARGQVNTNPFMGEVTDLSVPAVREQLEAPALRYEQTARQRNTSVVPAGGAAREASSLTKQATILEAPTAPAVCGQVGYTDADVALAAINRAPGEISVVRDIPNPGEVSGALARHIATGTGPSDFRVVARPGSDDLLVADGRQISPEVVDQYTRLGFFEGQQAMVPGGSAGRIRQAGAEWSMIEDQSGMVYWARNADIVPGRASMMSEVGSEAYGNFRGYAAVRMNDEAAAAGLGPVDWFSDEMATQLPRYIDEFLDQMEVQGEAARGAYKALFTQERVRDFRQLAPEEFALADEIAERTTREDAMMAVREGRPVWLEEVAEAKGLTWMQDPGGQGGRLRNRNTGQEFQLADREEGFQFLANYETDLPDYSPISTVPVELASSPASAGSSAGPKHNLTEVEVSTMAMRSMDRLEVELGGGVGGGLPPDVPPFGAFGPAPDGPPLLPPADETIGAQLERARLEDRATYDRVLQRFDNLAMKLLDPMRNFSLGIEDTLVRAGFDKGIYWQHYSAISNGRAVAHNEAAPWHMALNDALGKIRRRFIRDGTVTLIGEMNENVAVDAMEKAGYKPKEIEGQLQIRAVLEQLRQEYEVRQIMDYMPHLRSRVAAGDDIGDLDQMFTGTGKFFAEMVREGSLDVREMNAAMLLHRWVRAATFHRHVAPHVEVMANAWVNDPRVPLRLREPTRDWLNLVTHGHTPGQDVVVPGIRHVLNALQIPVTNGEVAAGFNWMMATMYRGALGGRVDVLMRDSIGPLFAAPRVGLKPIVEAYTDFFRSGRKREAMWAIAKAKGWVEHGMVPMGASEVFEAGFNVGAPGTAPVNEAMAPWQNTAREAWGHMGDVWRDAMPPGIRSGIQGTLADPLLAYTKLGEFNRLVSGWAGWTSMLRATETLADFRVRMPDGDLNRGIAAALMESGAANYPAPIQRRLVELLRSQQYEEAASVFANEVANSQFRYGTAEGTYLTRTSGVVGKVGSTYGTFTNQYVAQMREGLTQGGLIEELGGTSKDRVLSGTKFAAGHYLIGSALAAGATATGWNLAKWFWHGSLGWGGGPMLVAGFTKIQELSGRWQLEMGERASPMQLAAIQYSESNYPSPITLNPYAGAIRTAQGYATALGGAAPFESVLGYTMTGRQTSPDMVRQFTDPAFGVQELPGWLGGQQAPAPPPVHAVVTEGGGALQ